MNKTVNGIIAALWLAGTAVVQAQEGMDGHETHDMAGMHHDAMSVAGQSAAGELRDPDAFADGYDFGPIPRPRFADEQSRAGMVVNRLERQHGNDVTATAYDLRAWYGRDYRHLLLKAEGDLDGGELAQATTHLYWSRAVAPFWDMHLGLRQDGGAAPDRTWASVGVEGLAPYRFDLDTTLNIGDKGRALLSLEAEYELLLTQRLILQPRLVVDLRHKEDVESESGAGLSQVVAGLRLRYEVRREFAPYLGIEWARSYGATADYLRTAGDDPRQVRAVAGVRAWF